MSAAQHDATAIAHLIDAAKARRDKLPDRVTESTSRAEDALKLGSMSMAQAARIAFMNVRPKC